MTSTKKYSSKTAGTWFALFRRERFFCSGLVGGSAKRSLKNFHLNASKSQIEDITSVGFQLLQPVQQFYSSSGVY